MNAELQRLREECKNLTEQLYEQVALVRELEVQLYDKETDGFILTTKNMEVFSQCIDERKKLIEIEKKLIEKYECVREMRKICETMR